MLYRELQDELRVQSETQQLIAQLKRSVNELKKDKEAMVR